MSARAQILARLQLARPAEPLPRPDVAGYYGVHRRAEGSSERIHRFTAALQAAHAEVHLTHSRSWAALLCRLA